MKMLVNIVCEEFEVLYKICTRSSQTLFEESLPLALIGPGVYRSGALL